LDSEHVKLPESEFEPVKFVSEMIEPTVARCIGIWFHNCELARNLKEKIEKRCEEEKRNPTWREDLDCRQFFRQCSHFWWGLRAWNKLSIVTDGAVHFGIAIQNEQRRFAKYIKKYLGFCPILDKEKAKELGFV